MTVEEFVRLYREKGGKLRPPMYADISKSYRRAIAHTRGCNMVELIKGYRRTEDAEQLRRRKELLEPITKDMFDRTTDKLINVLSPSLVEVNASENALQAMQKAMFWSSLQKNVIPCMIDDPNGFMVMLPKPNSVNQTQRPDLVIWVINYEQVISYGKDHISFDKKISGADYVFFVSNQMAIRFIRQDDGELVLDEDYQVSYAIEYPPAIQLGGRMARAEDNSVYYASFFSSAFAHATKAVQIFSDREAMRMTANPLVIMQKQPCDNEGCMGGSIYGLHDIPDGEKCGTCHGTGFIKQRWNINDVIYADKEDLDETVNIENLIKFAVPPTENMEMQNTLYKEHMTKAEQALNLLFVSQAQSGTAKEIDREMQDAMLNAIAKNIYDRLVKFAFQIAEYFAGEPSNKVEVVIPSDFRGSSVEAILVKITELKQKGAPTGVIYPIYAQLYNTMYANNPLARKKALFQLDYDHLHIYADIASKRLASSSEREFEYSKQLPSALNRMANELGDVFLEMSQKQIADSIESYMSLPKEQVIIRNNNGE